MIDKPYEGQLLRAAVYCYLGDDDPDAPAGTIVKVVACNWTGNTYQVTVSRRSGDYLGRSFKIYRWSALPRQWLTPLSPLELLAFET